MARCETCGMSRDRALCPACGDDDDKEGSVGIKVERLAAALREMGSFSKNVDEVAEEVAAVYDRLTGEYEDREHDSRIDIAGAYVPPRADLAAPMRYDLLIASARVLRVVSDPALEDGSDEWVLGSVFEGDYERVLVGLIIEALIKEGMVERRGARLYPVPYEQDQG